MTPLEAIYKAMMHKDASIVHLNPKQAHCRTDIPPAGIMTPSVPASLTPSLHGHMQLRAAPPCQRNL